MPSPARALLEAALELLAPTRCAGCELPGVLLCDACRGAMPRIDPAIACPRCGAPRADQSASCLECTGREYAFSDARTYGSLAHPLSRLVSLYKDGGEERLAAPLAEMLAQAAGGWLAWADALVPLPASPSGLRRRGRDHMRQAVELMASESGVPSLRLLERLGGADQRTLGRDGRAANLQAALRVRPHNVIPEHILMLDDVFTTGATAHAAAGVLLNAGANEVRFVAVARALNPGYR